MMELHRLDKHPDIHRGLLSSQGTNNRIDIGKLNQGVREPLIKSWMNSLSPESPIAALASTCNSTAITSTYRLALKNPESQSISPRLNQRFLGYFQNNTRLFNTHNALLLFEKECSPVLYVPKSDIFKRHFLPSTKTTYCPYKGEANYWSLSVTDEIVIDAVWEYPAPISGVKVIEDHVAFANHQSGGEYLFYSI